MLPVHIPVGTLYQADLGEVPGVAVAHWQSIEDREALWNDLLNEGKTAMTAPKVTLDHINSRIRQESYFIMPDRRTTICHLELLNGFTVRGESACVCAENFNAELGEKYAREKAIDKVWELEGYLLKENLFQMTQPANAMPAPESFQDRVKAEKADLDDKIEKLSAFARGNVFLTLPGAEQVRLGRQVSAMREYADILGQRIHNFATFGVPA